MAFATKDIRSQKRGILILICIHYQDDIAHKTIERCSIQIESCLLNHNLILLVTQTNKQSQCTTRRLIFRTASRPLFASRIQTHAVGWAHNWNKKFVNCIVCIICHCDLQFAFQIRNQIKPLLCLAFTLILGQRGPERTLTWNEFANIYEYLNSFYLKLMHTLITD